MVSRRFEIFWRGRYHYARYSMGKDLITISVQHFLATLAATLFFLGFVGAAVINGEMRADPDLSIRFKLVVFLIVFGASLILALAHLVYFLIKNERHRKW